MILMAAALAAAFIIAIAVTLDPGVMSSITDAAVTDSHVLATCVTAAAGAIFGLTVLYYVKRLFGNIRKNNTPFTDENVRCLEIIAVLVIIGAIAIPAVSAAAAHIFESGAHQVEEFHLFSMLVGFIVYFLSLVFKYGTVLQKESDETL